MLATQAKEPSTHGRLKEREGRREAFLSGHTYSGLLFFSSSESELWWWIQLLSPFRVVRTFICLMILLRSSSVGGMTRPRRGRGKGRREKKGCWERARIHSVSRWARVNLREQGAQVSFQSEIQTLNESFATCDERWKQAVIQTSGSIYPDASPPL